MAQVLAGGVWCDTIAHVGGLTYSTRWGDGPSGCDVASWSMGLDPNETHPELARGQTVDIKVGPARIWKGLVAESARTDDGWQITATGLGREAARYECLTSGGAPTTIPSTAVTEAIARGLPWIAPTAWPAGFTTAYAAADTAQLNKLSTLLDAWCAANNKYWGVGADSVLFVSTAPTMPTWLTTPQVRAMGVADDDYVTHIYVRYVATVNAGPPITPATWTTTLTAAGAVLNRANAAALRWGRREEFVNLSDLGLMTSGAAQSQSSARMDKSVGRMGWTNALDVGTFELSDINGVPVDFSTVGAGQMLRIAGVFDTSGNLTVGTSVDVVLGEVRYADGAPTIYLAPVGLVPRTFTDVLADAPKPEPVMAG